MYFPFEIGGKVGWWLVGRLCIVVDCGWYRMGGMGFKDPVGLDFCLGVGGTFLVVILVVFLVGCRYFGIGFCVSSWRVGCGMF